MADFDKELDATLATAEAAMAEGARLTGEVEKARSAREEWERANGIDGELRRRFFAALPQEEQKRVADEQEAFERDLSHDLKAAVANAAGSNQPRTAKAKRREYL